MWVKICGITRREDAMMAARLGADALGFIFTKSPRNVRRGIISHWIREITIVEKVAVFMDESVDEILESCEDLGIDTIQLHAAPSRDHERLVPVYDIIYAMDEYRPGTLPVFPCRILIDASKGKGSRGVWEERDFPYILAGGLNPAMSARRSSSHGLQVWMFHPGWKFSPASRTRSRWHNSSGRPNHERILRRIRRSVCPGDIAERP